MKFFILGIQITPKVLKRCDAEKKFDFILKFLPASIENIKKTEGDDTIIVIALQEYAFTTQSILQKNKKEMLQQLQNLINNYPNVILIPGSFSYYEFSNNETDKIKEKRQLILANYEQPNREEDGTLEEEKNKFNNIYLNKLPAYIVHHSSYIITKNNKVKHRKSASWEECEKLSLSADEQKISTHSFFYIGRDNFLKTINLDNKKLNIKSVLCREQFWDKNTCYDDTETDITVISADSTTPDYEKFTGAITVFIDSKENFQVAINREHPKYSSNNEIKAIFYRMGMKHDSLVIERKRIDVENLADLLEAVNVEEFEP